MIKESLTKRPSKPVVERAIPVSFFDCKHDYRALSHDVHKATFYCCKCLDMRTKEL